MLTSSLSSDLIKELQECVHDILRECVTRILFVIGTLPQLCNMISPGFLMGMYIIESRCSLVQFHVPTPNRQAQLPTLKIQSHYESQIVVFSFVPICWRIQALFSSSLFLRFLCHVHEGLYAFPDPSLLSLFARLHSSSWLGP